MKTQPILAGVAGCIVVLAGLGYAAQAAGRDSGAITTRILLLHDRDPSQATHEVPDTRTFYDGQRFRVTVKPRTAGYLYVMCQSSQGEAKLLFPNESSDNFVQAGQLSSLPGRGWFRFDEEPGVEHIFIVLSDHPISDLDRAVNEGGDMAMSTLQHYATGSPDKGIEIGAEGINVDRTAPPVVKQLDLRHRSRRAE
jgi:hypothetical protein